MGVRGEISQWNKSIVVWLFFLFSLRSSQPLFSPQCGFDRSAILLPTRFKKDDELDKSKSELNDGSEEESGDDEYDKFQERAPTLPSTYNNLCAGIKELQKFSKTTRFHDAKLGQLVNPRKRNSRDATPCCNLLSFNSIKRNLYKTKGSCFMKISYLWLLICVRVHSRVSINPFRILFFSEFYLPRFSPFLSVVFTTSC